MGSNTVEEDLVMDIPSTLSNISGDSPVSPWADDTSQAPISTGRIGVMAYELNQVRQLFRVSYSYNSMDMYHNCPRAAYRVWTGFCDQGTDPEIMPHRFHANAQQANSWASIIQ